MSFMAFLPSPPHCIPAGVLSSTNHLIFSAPPSKLKFFAARCLLKRSRRHRVQMGRRIPNCLSTYSPFNILPWVSKSNLMMKYTDYKNENLVNILSLHYCQDPFSPFLIIKSHLCSLCFVCVCVCVRYWATLESCKSVYKYSTPIVTLPVDLTDFIGIDGAPPMDDEALKNDPRGGPGCWRGQYTWVDYRFLGELRPNGLLHSGRRYMAIFHVSPLTLNR